MTRWAPVPGFDSYEVSSAGEVRSVQRVDACGRHWPSVAKKIWPSEKGYLKVGLCAGGRTRSMKVHRLVLEAFVGPCPDGMMGCHNDGDRRNNRLENLRWATAGENMADREAHGMTARGERVSQSKLTPDQVYAIRAMVRAGEPKQTVGRRFGVSARTVRSIVQGKLWRHLPAERTTVTVEGL